MKNNTFLWIFSCIIFSVSCNSKNDKLYALNENFDSNEIGWPEESTSSHTVEIENGMYTVHSKTIDTTKVQTSAGPQNRSFLYNLPGHYQIMSLIKGYHGGPKMEYGIMLNSASLSYRFALTGSGKVFVTEYDYNTESEDTLIHGNYLKLTKIGPTGVKFTFDIRDRNLNFILDDKAIGSCLLKTKQWEDIRLFTTIKSKISIDYLRVVKKD